MSGIAREEHWLDRLAVRQTRRQLLRAALAGGALTVPLLRPFSARAAEAGSPTDCRRGCLYTARQRYLAQSNRCFAAAGDGLLQGSAIALFFNPFYGLARTGAGLIGSAACQNVALLAEKAAAFDCLQPDCPGFDPKGPQGPCVTCTAHCCADQQVTSGYSCCAICCNKSGNGCGSSQSDC